jgi:molybdate transport system regulatory protein
VAAIPSAAGDLGGSTLARLSIRIDLDGGFRIGPGKIRLLELIEATGSISAADRHLAAIEAAQISGGETR